MTFFEFERAIQSPALKQVAGHWNEARKDRQMPAWADIKPARIAPYLSIVWSFHYDRQNDEFVGRLVGQNLARHIGKGIKGLSLAEAYPPDAISWVLPLFERVVREPALYGYAGPLFHQQDHDGSGERIMLPLSEDGIESDGVLGATFLNEANSAPLILLAPQPQDELWYSLRVSSDPKG